MSYFRLLAGCLVLSLFSPGCKKEYKQTPNSLPADYQALRGETVNQVGSGNHIQLKTGNADIS